MLLLGFNAHKVALPTVLARRGLESFLPFGLANKNEPNQKRLLSPSAHRILLSAILRPGFVPCVPFPGEGHGIKKRYFSTSYSDHHAGGGTIGTVGTQNYSLIWLFDVGLPSTRPAH